MGHTSLVNQTAPTSPALDVEDGSGLVHETRDIHGAGPNRGGQWGICHCALNSTNEGQGLLSVCACITKTPMVDLGGDGG